MKPSALNPIRAALACAAFANLAVAAEKMEVAFDESNALRHIKVGNATFATGGGDLWTAEFSDGTNRRNRCPT